MALAPRILAAAGLLAVPALLAVASQSLARPADVPPVEQQTVVVNLAPAGGTVQNGSDTAPEDHAVPGVPLSDVPAPSAPSDVPAAPAPSAPAPVPAEPGLVEREVLDDGFDDDTDDPTDVDDPADTDVDD